MTHRNHPIVANRWVAALTCAALCVVAFTASAQLDRSGSDRARSELDTSDAGAFSQADIDAAVKSVQADPNLAQERTVRALRWRGDKQDDKEKEKQRKRSGSNWFGDFLSFIAETSRVIVWLALAVALALLAVLIMRLVREIGPRNLPIAFSAPTHVRDLDIRPESLPDDIGAEALALWNRDERRAALALLYRGLLSRLVHVHEVPIKHSSTEGECLLLAKQSLPAMRAEYAARLIRLWQRAVYGAQEPATSEVEWLCGGFADALDKPPPANQAEYAT